MNKLYISPEAQKDLLEIKKYITEELENPTAAINIVTQITKRIRELPEFPLLGPSLESIIGLQTKYRFLVCGSYTLFYRHEEASIYIDRVLYGRRDFMKILFGELPEEEK